MDYRSATLKEWAARVARGELSAEALMASTLDRIEQLNPALSAFTELRPRETVLAEARAVDEARSRGESLSPLAGMPLGVKDLEDAAGLLSTYGSALYGQTPATEDSILVSRLTTPARVSVGTPLPWSGLPGAPPVAAAPPWPRGSFPWRRGPTAAVPFAFLRPLAATPALRPAKGVCLLAMPCLPLRGLWRCAAL